MKEPRKWARAAGRGQPPGRGGVWHISKKAPQWVYVDIPAGAPPKRSAGKAAASAAPADRHDGRADSAMEVLRGVEVVELPIAPTVACRHTN
jgi:hypothetical protein